MHIYKAFNGAMVTTAALAAVATGTAIKTMLQISTPSTRQIKVISWGFSIDAAQNGQVELIQTDVAATVTAHVAAGIQPQVPGMPASLITLGASNTGYSASAEGAITATRLFDNHQPDVTAGTTDLNYRYQFMPDERPIVAVSSFLRVRATFATSTNMLCWITWDE